MKKIFIISIIILVLSLSIWGAYNFAFDSQSYKENDLSLDGKKEHQEKGNLQKYLINELSEDYVVDPVLVDGKYIHFFNKKGELKKITLDGAIKEDVFESEGGVKNAIWATEKDMVIVEKENLNKKNFYLQNYKTRKREEIKDNVDNIIWTNLKDKIVYKYFDPIKKERSLNVANPNGSNWQMLTKLDSRFRNMKMEMVSQSTFISYWNYPSSNSNTTLNLISLLGGESKEIVSGKKGADFLWSPDGKQILSSYVEKNKIKMGVYTKKADEYKLYELNVPTLVSKCKWGKDSVYIYCAIPKSSMNDYKLPDDYYKENFYTEDTFWRINTKSGKRERILDEDLNKKSVDAQNLILSPSEDRLFFTDRKSGKLYVILR